MRVLRQPGGDRDSMVYRVEGVNSGEHVCVWGVCVCVCLFACMCFRASPSVVSVPCVCSPVCLCTRVYLSVFVGVCMRACVLFL